MEISLYDKIQLTAAHIQQLIKESPTVGIILGTGLGMLAESVDKEIVIPYKDIPYFSDTTVKSHDGKLIIGKMGGKQVIMMAGRFHYYEGYNMEAITYPVRVMKALGVHTLLISNAAGGMNLAYEAGDIMILDDHINLFPEHPLRGPNDERLGPRFPDMSEPYDLQLIATVKTIAQEKNIPVHVGVYAGLQGPTFETKAEYKMLFRMGADAVGMSSVPEALVALHGNMRVFTASIITDIWREDMLAPLTLDEVLAAANKAAPKLAILISELAAHI